MKQFGILAISLLLMTACGGQTNNKTKQEQTTSNQKSHLLAPEDFKAAVEADSDYYLIDVRTPKEYDEGTIMDAKNLNLTDGTFQSEIKNLDKNKTVYLFCHSGNRSGKAAKILKQEGFQEIIDLKGGIVDWKKSNP